MSPDTVLLDRSATAGVADPAVPIIGPATGRALHVMSYNIRFHHSGTRAGHPDHWPDRAPRLARLLQLEQPTLLGVQEALYHQLPVVEQALPAGYRMVGYGRAGGSKGEYSAIFYDARRLELLEWDQFWLSGTPELIGSTTWGNDIPRIVTWGRFLDRGTGTELVLVNTHFDHDSEDARDRSAEALVDLVHSFHPHTPTVVTGDFNAEAGGSGAYATLVGSGLLADTWTAAEERLTPAWGTFPDYGEAVEGEERIDWVLAGPDVKVRRVAINTARFAGGHPSDHAPVQALVTLGQD
ncbi:endonuclease/exonuclease/phosphatase family protein [Kocuria arenosa]|uniref:endonuclease/exonuclease/phosphatase family protein n=1 Tax=Kocuria arenosa TaxID=3071446 RepID=UPI0034D7A6E6